MHPALRARAERRFGLFTTAEAIAAGYGHSEIRSLCGTGRWFQIRRGVLISASDLAAADQRGHRHDVDCLAVLMSLGRGTAFVSHGSAGRLWGLPVPQGLEPTIRLTDTEQWRRGTDWRMVRAPLLPAQRWRKGPLRLTSAARTLVDCAREWPLPAAVVAMDAGLLAKRTTPEELRSVAAGVHHWPGATRARRAAALADGRAESPLETRTRLRIVGAGLPTPALQVEIRAAGGLIGVVDGWFEEAAVALECDGRVKYADPWRGRTAERVLWEEKREDELRALDIRFVRIVDPDLGPARWPAVEARLRHLVASPGPAIRRFTAVPRTRGVARTA
jgi:hypothetical protein